MAHTATHPAIPQARPVAGPRQAGATWRPLYRTAAAAALITALLIPIQIAIFIAYPFPDTVAGWFALLQQDPLPALVDLDLLLVVDNVLLAVIALALYVALREVSPSIILVATGLWLLAIAMLITANPAIGLLGLSGQFAAATSEAQRSATLAAGQALLAGWEGTAFQVSYVVGQLAGIIVGVVMLRGRLFSRAVPLVLIIGNVLGFGYYLPRVGLAVSAFSGVVLWIWYLLIARPWCGWPAAGPHWSGLAADLAARGMSPPARPGLSTLGGPQGGGVWSLAGSCLRRPSRSACTVVLSPRDRCRAWRWPRPWGRAVA